MSAIEESTSAAPGSVKFAGPVCDAGNWVIELSAAMEPLAFSLLLSSLAEVEVFAAKPGEFRPRLEESTEGKIGIGWFKIARTAGLSDEIALLPAFGFDEIAAVGPLPAC